MGTKDSQVLPGEEGWRIKRQSGVELTAEVARPAAVAESRTLPECTVGRHQGVGGLRLRHPQERGNVDGREPIDLAMPDREPPGRGQRAVGEPDGMCRTISVGDEAATMLGQPSGAEDDIFRRMIANPCRRQPRPIPPHSRLDGRLSRKEQSRAETSIRPWRAARRASNAAPTHGHSTAQVARTPARRSRSVGMDVAMKVLGIDLAGDASQCQRA